MSLRAQVLLVEDEYYIADDLRRTLDAAGATVVGPCSTLFKAQEAVEKGAFDCAVIDLNRDGESAVPADRWTQVIRHRHRLRQQASERRAADRKAFPRSVLRLVGQLSCARPVRSA